MFKRSVAALILLAAGISLANSAELTVPSKRHHDDAAADAARKAAVDESTKAMSDTALSRKAGNAGTM